MNQHFHVSRAGNAHSVAGLGGGGNHAVKGSNHHVLLRNNAYAPAQNAAGEGLIGNFRVGNHLACHGSQNFSCLTGHHRCLLLLLCSGFRILPHHQGENEGNAAGNGQQDGVEQGLVDNQVAGEAGNAVAAAPQAHNGAEHGADCAANHAADKGLHEAEVHAEDGRLRNAQRSGQRGGHRHGTGLHLMGLYSHRQTGAALGEVGSGGNGHPDIQPLSAGEHTHLNHIVHMMQAADHRQGVDGTHHQGAHAIAHRHQPLGKGQDVGLGSGEDGSDDGKGNKGGSQHRHQGGDKQVNDLRHNLVQPLLNPAHEPHGDNHRNHVALVAHLGHLEEQQLPGGNGFHTGNGPGIDQAGIDHGQTHNAAQEQIAAEHPGGADGHQHRQIGKSGGRNHVQETVPVRPGEGGNHLAQSLHQTHHQACGHNGGKNGYEYVAQSLDHSLGQGLLGSSGGLDLLLGGGGHTGDGEKLVINLVDGAGADDQLELTVGVEYTLDSLRVLQCRHVNLAVVCDYQPEPGRTVCCADDIFPAT